MKQFLLSVIVALCLATGASAQVITANGAKSDEIMAKIHQIDILNQILPLAIRKEQFEPLLHALEKARQKEKKTREFEDGELAKISGDVSDTVTNGIDKGTFPPHATLVHVASVLSALNVNRQIAMTEMLDDFVAATSTVFDAGQKKVMANSLDAASLDPSVKKDQMKEDDKVRFFIKKVFMDQVTYDLLLKLQKKAS